MLSEPEIKHRSTWVEHRNWSSLRPYFATKRENVNHKWNSIPMAHLRCVPLAGGPRTLSKPAHFWDGRGTGHQYAGPLVLTRTAPGVRGPPWSDYSWRNPAEGAHGSRGQVACSAPASPRPPLTFTCQKEVKTESEAWKVKSTWSILQSTIK